MKITLIAAILLNLAATFVCGADNYLTFKPAPTSNFTTTTRYYDYKGMHIATERVQGNRSTYYGPNGLRLGSQVRPSLGGYYWSVSPSGRVRLPNLRASQP